MWRSVLCRFFCVQISLFFIQLIFVFPSWALENNPKGIAAIDPRLYQTQAASEVKKGNYARAVDLLQQALKQSSKSASLKQNLSAALADWARLLWDQKSIADAADKLKQAVEADSKNGPAWFLMGDIAYLHQSDFKSAVLYWKKALPLAPSPIQKQIIERISRAELDGHLEHGYVSITSTHFDVRFPSGFKKQEAERMSQYLEGEYAKFSRELKINPPQLTLIIYEKQSFDRLTGAHDETLGLYDGRIRIGSREVHGPYESIILSHELAHAFLQHAFGNHLPIWIQEGYAQAKEPVRILTEDQKRIEKELKSGTGWIPLKWLDRKFSQPANLEDVSRSYLQARLTIAAILKKSVDGVGFQQFLGRVSKGEPLKEAFEASFNGLSWNSIEYGRF